MYRAWKQGQTAYAQRLATVAAKLTAALFRESNPAPVKYALASMSLILPRVRLPLVEVKSDAKAEIDLILAHMCERYPRYMIGDVAKDRSGIQSGDHLRQQRKFAVVS
jgi:dihydrodipicolinate synthase/N-acetylneuraminate lyase